jgi:hypothetical protein
LIIGLLVGVLLVVDTDLLAILLGDLFNLLNLISSLVRPLLKLFLGHSLEVLLLLLVLQLGVLVVAYLVELLHKLHVMVISRHSSLLLILLVLNLFVNYLLLSLLLLELWLLELLLSLSELCGIGDLLLMVGGFVNTGILIGGDILRLDFGYLLLKLATFKLLLLLEEHLILLLLLDLLLLLLLLGVRNQGLRLVPLTSETGLLLLLLVRRKVVDLWLRVFGRKVLGSILCLLLLTTLVHHLLELHLIGQLLLADDWGLLVLLLLLLL